MVVFAEEPTLRKTGAKEWQIQIPMRCQNLAGAVEVVLGSGSSVRTAAPAGQLGSDADPRQLTGCTSPTDDHYVQPRRRFDSSENRQPVD